MENKTYDLVVCAGISAVKWIANKEPEKDKAKIKELADILNTIKTKQFILISTIDVYSKFKEKNEDYKCVIRDCPPYGKHRLEFEHFCFKKFSDCTIVRLPSLFGKGLKKNIIYDLLNDNCLKMINKRSSFQYYNLNYLWNDIQKAMQNDIKLINLFTEPIKTLDIITSFFPIKKCGEQASAESHYNLQTKYAHLWEKNIPYIYTREEVMKDLHNFITQYKNKRKK